MRYLSLFSGIEAASVAWVPLGWECVAVSEIEPYPCAVLAHHYPTVPNLGDITKITEADIAMLGGIDLVVFGSPCQDLSVAGKRKGLDGARSGLFFTAMQIVEWARTWGGCRFAVWENVPGAFSSNAGADFAVVVGQLAGVEEPELSPKGWGTEGAIVGTKAMVEWSVLDAQWAGVAQRRRRVFAVADFGDWASRPPILLEPESLRGDTAPSREAGQSVAGTLASRTGAGGEQHTSACRGIGDYSSSSSSSSSNALRASGADLGPGCEVLIAQSVALRGREGGGTAELGGPVSGTLRASGGGGDKQHVLVGLQRPVLEPARVPPIAMCLNAGGMGRIDYETETFIVTDDVSPTLLSGATSPASHGKKNGTDREELVICGTLQANGKAAGSATQQDAESGMLVVCATGAVTHTLKADGFDASEDGTGRGTPIVSVLPFDTTQITSASNYSSPKAGDPCHPLAAGMHPPAIAFPANLSGTQCASAEDLSPSLGAVNPTAVAFQSSQSGVRIGDVHATHDSNNGPRRHNGALVGMQVRRLTPRECERLQAFQRLCSPDTPGAWQDEAGRWWTPDYTAITVRGKPAADGPRYKALGNSMCVNVMHWIGKQIDHVTLFY